MPPLSFSLLPSIFIYELSAINYELFHLKPEILLNINPFEGRFDGLYPVFSSMACSIPQSRWCRPWAMKQAMKFKTNNEMTTPFKPPKYSLHPIY
jgi:hypothetical protein